MRIGTRARAKHVCCSGPLRPRRRTDSAAAGQCRAAWSEISYDDPGSLDAAFQGASAVIHLAGILVETPDSTYEQANVASTRSVVEAAKRSGVQKFVLVSATGADETSSNRYYRTKGQAEALVRASGLCYTILRAPLLLGPGTEGGAALGAERKPAQSQADRRRPQFSTASLCGRPGAGCDRRHQSIGREQSSLWTWLVPSRCRSGNSSSGPPACWAARSGSARFQRIAFAWCWPFVSASAGPGFSTDALEVITADTRLDPQPAASELGIELTGIDEMIKNSLGQG